MNWIRITVPFLALLFCTIVYGRGNVETERFYSESMVSNTNIQIYLPEGYNSDNNEVLYPVIYFLHGAGMDYDDYTQIYTALDTLIGAEIEPVIVVKPSGLFGEYGRLSWWSDSDLNGYVETYVVADLVEYVEGHYNVASERSKRCIMGHSMGGYGAMKIALKHPDKYCGVVSHSGVVHSTSLIRDIYIPEMLGEHGGEGPFDPQRGTFSLIIFSLAAAFTPNFDNAPHLVDLPVDDDGNIIDEVFNRWIEEDPSWLASQIDPVDSPAIFIDACENEGVFPQQNTFFADTLDYYEIEHLNMVFPGADHHRDLPQRYPASLGFLNDIMSSISSIENDYVNNLPDCQILYPAFPNPFNSTTRIGFDLPYTSWISIKVYNQLGQSVASLADGRLESGRNTVIWDAAEMSAGTYFVKMKDERGFVGSQRVVLSK